MIIRRFIQIAPWLVIAILSSSCATVTPYGPTDLDMGDVREKRSPENALFILKTKCRVDRAYADVGSFAMDEEGFSYVKTTKTSKQEWKGDKPITVNYTNTQTRSVPWTAMTAVSGMHVQYSALFSDKYVAHITFRIAAVQHGQRSYTSEYIEFVSTDFSDLREVVNALKTLGDL